MKVNSKQYCFLKDVLTHWEQKKLISRDQNEQLQGSLDVRSFNWKLLAGYLFWAALSSLGLSLLTVLMDDILLDWLKQLFSLSPAIKSASLFTVAVLTYVLGYKWQEKDKVRRVTHELIYVPGSALLAGSIYFLGVAFDSGSEHYSVLVLLLAIIYLVAAVMCSSMLVWCLALICLAFGVVSEVVYQLGWEDTYLESRIVMLIAVYGFWTLGVSYSLLMFERVKRFFIISQSSSLILGLFAVWLLSVVEMDSEDVGLWSVFSLHWFWLVLFSLLSIGVAGMGFWLNDSVFRLVGISFIFINIYTRFFEYGWDEMHKALFFALLGGSFWVLGRMTESIWIKEENREGK